MEDNLQVVTMKAHADYSAAQFTLGTVNSSGYFQTTTAGAAADGVLQDKPAAQGRACQVGISGISKVRAGGTFAVGDLLASDGTGRVVEAATGDNILGKAMTAGTVNCISEVLLKLQNTNAIA